MQNIIPFLIGVPFIAAVCVFALRKVQPAMGQSLGIVAAFSLLVATLGMAKQATTVGLPEANADNGLLFAPERLQIDLPITLSGHPVHWQIQFGLDGISWVLVSLTALICVSVAALAIKHIRNHTCDYLGWMLVAEGCLMGVFTARDLLSFYIFFEAVLFPLLVLMHQYGEAGKAAAAAKKFLLFTLVGSFPLLIGLIILIVQSGNSDQGTSISLIGLHAQENGGANLASWLILFGFGVKMALLPLHSWLPTTYTTSHPTTAALLAAVVSKMGTYGLIRIFLPTIAPSQIETFQMVLGVLGIAAILYGAIVALSQTELRYMLAYSSISHMGFIVIGLAAMNEEGLSGAAIQMLNHGLIIGGLFLATGMWEARGGKVDFGEKPVGRALQAPVLSSFFVLLILAGTGLPGLNSFAGELLTLSGMFRVCAWATGIASLGLILGAWYSLRCLQRMLFATPLALAEASLASHSHDAHDSGHHGKPHAVEINSFNTAQQSLSPGEYLALVPILSLCVFLGVFPQRAIAAVKPEMQRMAIVAPGATTPVAETSVAPRPISSVTQAR